MEIAFSAILVRKEVLPENPAVQMDIKRERIYSNDNRL